MNPSLILKISYAVSFVLGLVFGFSMFLYAPKEVLYYALFTFSVIVLALVYSHTLFYWMSKLLNMIRTIDKSGG